MDTSGVPCTKSDVEESHSSASPVPRMPGALVTNLTVNAKVHNATRQTLQLFVSWIPPKRSSLPRGYQMPIRYALFLKLLDVNDTYCTLSSLHDEHISIYDTETKNISFPDTVSVAHGSDMRIRPQCTYQVIVESYPFYKEDRVAVNYTVPDCVKQVCKCSRLSTIPVASQLNFKRLQNNDYNITWKLDAKDINIKKVYLGLGEESLHSQHSLLNFTIQEEMDATHILSPHQMKLIPSEQLKPGHSYQVKVVVVDSRGCKWPAGNLNLDIPNNTTENGQMQHSEGPKNKIELVLVVLVFVLLFMVAVCLALFVVWQRYGGWMRCKFGAGQLQPIRSWRGVYKVVSMESRVSRSFSALQERNIIYVEKEIEDAKARGDADAYEVSYTRLDLGRQIGKGAFGRVFLARAEAIANIPGYMTIAVKKLKHRASLDEVEEFLSEIAMMKCVGQHPNIVTMLGCCTLQEPFCMLMEYVPCGDLLQYLRHLRIEYERHMGGTLPFMSTMQRSVPSISPRYVDLLMDLASDGSYVQPEIQLSSAISGRPSITETEWSILSSDGVPLTPTEINRPQKLECVLDHKELQRFAVQIARGMAHLELKQITHRDLAARNVLIDEHKILKISDFGLSRSGIYVNTKRKKVPLRWLSVEAMRDNLYSSKSDVWAFAIVLWEIGTLGGFPYPTVADMNLLTFLLDGKRLEKPDNCSDELYSLMLKCWSHSADIRPTFAELVSYLDSVICRKRVYVDFNHLRPSYTFPPMEQQAVMNASEHKSVEHKLL